VLLSVTSQSFASAETCNWKKLNSDINQAYTKISGCESPTSESVFLGRPSKEIPILKILEIQTSLTVIEDERFVAAINLKSLNLCCNRIQHVHEKAFVGLNKLSTLRMDFNQLHSLPMNLFANLLVLTSLDLESNNLTSFDFSVVKQNYQLTRLRIDSNAITHVMTSQQYSSNLTSINMIFNSISSMPLENLPNCPKLQYLFIYQNNLTEFEFESVKEKFPRLKKFNFWNNVFDCCYLRDMVRSMLLRMPNLSMDPNFIKYLNDTLSFQRVSKCVTCDRPSKNIERLEREFFIIGLGFAIGVAFDVIVQILVGILFFCYF
jgi:Leucine-rich repeat (LRR) protein